MKRVVCVIMPAHRFHPDESETGPLYPPLPRLNDPRWQKMIVYPKRQRQTHLLHVPDPQWGDVTMTLYRGDYIHVIHDLRHRTWVAARAGDRLGWLNLWHAELLRIRTDEHGNPLPHMIPIHDDDDDMDETVEIEIPRALILSQVSRKLNEVEQPTRSSRPSQNEISRIIRHLKHITDGLRRNHSRD